MDTRLLSSFLTVLRAGGITAAAADLGFVQSTVTTHIQALERLVGTPLLDRHPAGVSPTRAGSLLAGHAQQILDLEERMLTELAAAATKPAGPVRLCAPESVCAYYLAPALPEVRTRFPDVSLSLFPASTRTALTALAARKLAGDHVPKKGEKIVLSGRRNLSAGSDVADFTTDVPGPLANVALKASEAIGLRVAGVDVFDVSPKRDLSDLVIIEVNGNPGMQSLEAIGRDDLIDDIWTTILQRAFADRRR